MYGELAGYHHGSHSMSNYCHYIWVSRFRRKIQCVNCGNTRFTKHEDLELCRRKCGKKGKPGRWRPQTKLGDFVSACLASIGITKKRYSRLLVFLYLRTPQRGCGGCGARQEKLNRIGDGVLRWWRSLRGRV